MATKSRKPTTAMITANAVVPGDTELFVEEEGVTMNALPQSDPEYPALQEQTPALQVPCPEQAEGQVLAPAEQLAPEKPESHKQMPAVEVALIMQVP